MFDKEFVWGCASSAYQIEGAWNQGGRGESIWDRFCHEGGHVLNGDTGDVSCDFYHHYREDIALMKQMGVKAYRFSLSWSRILPEGVGRVNPEGIRFYNDVIDTLLEAGIEPYITLYHWDYPQALQDRGGWLREESIQWFAEYAGVVSEAFSDRVTRFITLNEPQCFTGIAHLHCEHAPGIPFNQKQMFQMVHNVLRAHGAGVIALREKAKQPIQVGYAPTCGMVYPKTETQADIDACRKYLFRCPEDLNNWTWNVPWFSDPVFLGKYPEDGLKKYAEYLPEITEADMALISQPLDFMGENIYNGIMLEADENGEPRYVDRQPGFPITGNFWPVTPECFRWGLKFLYERYKLPIYVTENGMCCKDVVSCDGGVHDPQRIDFLNRYILAMRTAMDEGVDIRGYFQWTLTDNFEWNLGFRDRFGLIYVDFETQRRIRKDSSYWYQELIATRGASLKAERRIGVRRPQTAPAGREHRVDGPWQLPGDCEWVYIREGFGTCGPLSVRGGDLLELPEGVSRTLDGEMDVIFPE
nr:beta-glucosidase [uncultured bacterium]